MRKLFQNKFNKTLLIIILLFIIDFLLTLYFINVSGLVDEGNPLINVGSGYPILILNVVYFIIVLIFTMIIKKYETIIIPAKNTFDYTKKIFHNEISSKFIFISFMFSFVYASIVSRVITITDWIVFAFKHGSFFDSTYNKIRLLMPFGRFDIIISIISIFIFLPLWYKIEYEKSKKQIVKNLDN